MSVLLARAPTLASVPELQAAVVIILVATRQHDRAARKTLLGLDAGKDLAVDAHGC